MKPSVLVVDDERELREAVAQILELEGYRVDRFERPRDALESLSGGALADCVVSDIRMPVMDGLELFAEIKALDEDLPVVLVTGHGDIQTAVRAIRDGVYDFIEKPFRREQFLDVVRRATEKRRLVVENRKLKRQLSEQQSELLIGDSASMHRFKEELGRLACTGVDILVNGETGTGKELAARSIHRLGPRRDGPFVAVNCSAIPETMIEAELFGYEPGSFTGATGRRIGKFEHANGGTLFLDEVESISPSLATKILRVVQERSVERLGTNQPVQLDIQIVAATKADLKQLADAGEFRADLYYRLNVAELFLPPLRERGNDIILLFQYFADAAGKRFDRSVPELDEAVIAGLMGHTWPGNVRELRNVAERFVLGNSLELSIDRADRPAEQPVGLAQKVADFEKHLIEQALRNHNGNVRQTCAHLGTARKTLYDKLSRYGIDPREFR